MGEPAPGKLLCVAARVMVPEDWPGELGPDWPAACAAVGLDPAGPSRRGRTGSGYGLVLCIDNAGGPWTTITSDPDTISSIASMFSHSDFVDFVGYEPSHVIETRPGWLAYPDAGAVGPLGRLDPVAVTSDPDPAVPPGPPAGRAPLARRPGRAGAGVPAGPHGRRVPRRLAR